MRPEIVIEDPSWADWDLQTICTAACAATARELALGDGWEVTVLACDDARIADLNGDFRDKHRATNVLSWPSQDRAPQVPGAIPPPPVPDMFGDRHLGDIALARETCLREADDGGLAPAHHLTHLVIHAVLHLLGYDHETDADAQVMEGLETKILGDMGIADPYDTAKGQP